MKNRKYAVILLTIVMTLVFAACGSSTSSSNAAQNADSNAAADAGAASEYKTFADIFALGSGDYLQSISEDKIVYVVTVDGVSTRYEGVGTEEIYKAVDAIPFDDEDRDAKIQEIVGQVEITRADVLPAAPSEEEVESLVGKTGQELMDAGYAFTAVSVYDEETTVTAVKDYGSYMFSFGGAVDEDSTAWMDEVAKLTSTSAYYAGIDYSAISEFKY